MEAHNRAVQAVREGVTGIVQPILDSAEEKSKRCLASQDHLEEEVDRLAKILSAFKRTMEIPALDASIEKVTQLRQRLSLLTSRLSELKQRLMRMIQKYQDKVQTSPIDSPNRLAVPLQALKSVTNALSKVNQFNISIPYRSQEEVVSEEKGEEGEGEEGKEEVRVESPVQEKLIGLSSSDSEDN